MANSSCVAGSTTATVAAVSSPLKTPFRNPKPNPSGSFLLFSLPTTARGSPPSRRRRGPSIPIRSGSPQPNQRTGIWSIWEDLRMPSSRYFPVEAQGGQGPPPMVQERFQSVISQLFQHRIIRCGGAVDDDMANIIVGAAAVSGRRRSYQGMAIFDTMRHIRPDVSTVCVGLAASMGAFLLSAGTKGRRYSLPNSRIMIHQPLGGAPVSRQMRCFITRPI